jgi:hypothetical protein
MRVAWLVGCIWLCLMPTGAIARAESLPSCAANEAACRTPSEDWVERQVREGRPADLGVYCSSVEASDVERCGRLRPLFVRQLIGSTAVDDRAAPHGITLRHATICASRKDPDVCDESIAANVDPRGPIANRAWPLDLRDLRSRVALDLAGNLFRCDLQLGGAYFEQVLNLDDATIDGSMDAHNLRVDGSFTLVNVTLRGDLDADGLRASNNVRLFRSVVFGALHMRGAALGSDLDLGHLLVLGPWPDQSQYFPDAPRSSVGTPRSGVDLSNSQIGRQLFLTGAAVSNSDTDLSGIVTGGSIWMETDTLLPLHLTLERAWIGDSLMMGGGQFNQIDLTGAHIEHELRLEAGGVPATWKGGRYSRDNSFGPPKQMDSSTWFGLRNATVAAIRDTLTAWPDCVITDGFTYSRPPHDYAGKTDEAEKSPKPIYRWCRRLEPKTAATCPDLQNSPIDTIRFETCAPPATLLSGRDWTRPDRWTWLWGTAKRSEVEAIETRNAIWWRNWLERDPELTSKSFHQLGAALDTVGDGERADAIRFDQRIFERDGDGFLKYLLTWVEEILIGFGIGTYGIISLFWALLSTLIAAVFLRRRLGELSSYPDAQGKHFSWCFFASLQTLIPLIVISKQMDDFLHTPVVAGRPDTQPLRGPLALWFSALAVLGLLLSGFLLNGLRSYAGI